MTTMRERLVRLASLKLVLDTLRTEETRVKTELMEDVGNRMGATGALLPDGTEGATVFVSRGRAPKWEVFDSIAWAKWVQKKRPSAIVMAVRESDEKDLLAKMGQLIEEAGGEVPPGVRETERGEPYTSIKQSPEQRENTVRAWRSGELQLIDGTALIEGGEQA